MTFVGFDRAALDLLERLPDLSAGEYADQKVLLSAGLTKPAGALITEVADRLDADLTVATRSSVSPLHRDLRFAPEGAARYKDHQLLTSWEGSDKRSAPVLWIRIDSSAVGFASGVGFTPVVRRRWRSAIGGAPGEALAGTIAQLVARHGADVAGDEVKRVPAPFDADHPRADLLRLTGFQVRFLEPLPASVETAAFADWCVERLGALLPVHRWLRTHLFD